MDRDRSVWENVEAILYMSKQLLAEKVGVLLENQEIEESANLLDSWVQKHTDANLRLLKSLK